MNPFILICNTLAPNMEDSLGETLHIILRDGFNIRGGRCFCGWCFVLQGKHMFPSCDMCGEKAMESVSSFVGV